MKRLLILSILVMGLSGMVAQVLLLRELLIIFHGNELTIGIILANWLILEAMGAFLLGKKAEHISKKLEGYVLIQLFFSLFLPLAIYFTRIIRTLFGIIPGEGLGLGLTFLFSFIILLPVSISHGALFTFGCKLFSLYSRSDTEGIGKVYVYETIGTIIGGFFFTYILLPYFNSFQLAFFVAFLNLFLCILLLERFWEKEIISKIIGFFSSFLFLVSFILIFGKGIDKIHNDSIKIQWEGYKVLHYQNSFFGNIVVGEKDGSLNFFFNGIPVITLPHPDTFFVEEFSHFSLLSHQSPKEVLIIGRGAGGIINEILKHHVEKIDYVELDPIFLKTIEKFSTPLTEKELGNPKVNIIYTDGRFYIKKTEKKYDLIILGFSNQSDLQSNRYFTSDFFSLVKKRLKEDGILVFGLPSLPRAVLSLREIRELNACILNTLKNVYRNIKVIPGDTNNLYFASESKEIELFNSQTLIERLRERNIVTALLIPSYIEYRLQSFWNENFWNSLKEASITFNTDFRPLATFYSLAYWNTLFSPYLVKVFRNLEKIIPWVIFLILVIFVLFFFMRKVSVSIPLSILTTGFCGMLFDLMLIFSFQINYGYLFRWIGFLVTAFMSGIALGGYVLTKNLEKIRKDTLLFSGIELSIILFSLLLSLAISQSIENYFIFLTLSFIGGLLIGMQFPLANKIYLRSNSNLSKSVGILYSGDLLGGWLGGILGGILLIPFLGILETCFLIFVLKIASLSVFVFAKKV